MEQKKGESIRKFVKRFIKELIEIEEYDTRFIIAAMTNRIKEEKLVVSLYTQPPILLKVIIKRVEMFIIA